MTPLLRCLARARCLANCLAGRLAQAGLIGAVVFFGLAGTALAQDSSSTSEGEERDRRTWFSFEMAVVSEHRTGVFGLNHVRSGHFVGVRYTQAIGTDVWTGPELLGGFRSEVGLLYGRPVTWNWGQASLQSGIALVWGEAFTSDSGSGTTVGVPLQATLYLTVPYRPLDWLGVKVGGYGNVNPEDSFGGVTVGFVIGKLR
jgi:hypothetical protein